MASNTAPLVTLGSTASSSELPEPIEERRALFSDDEKIWLRKYLEQYTAADRKGRKDLLGNTVLVPFLDKFYPGITGSDRTLKKIHVSNFFANNARSTNAVIKVWNKKLRFQDVVLSSMKEEFEGWLEETGKAAQKKKGIGSLQLQLTEFIQTVMTVEEKKRVQKLKEQYEEDVYPLDLQIKNYEKSSYKANYSVDRAFFQKMGQLRVTFVASHKTADKMRVEMIDNMKNIVPFVDFRSMEEMYPAETSAFWAAWKLYTNYIRQCELKAGGISQMPPTLPPPQVKKSIKKPLLVLECTSSGLPLMPLKTPNETGETARRIVRSYLTKQYECAGGIDAPPYSKIMEDMSYFISRDCYPPGFIIRDPSNMSATALMTLCDFIRNRQEICPEAEVFRFIRVCRGRLSSEIVDATYFPNVDDLAESDSSVLVVPQKKKKGKAKGKTKAKSKPPQEAKIKNDADRHSTLPLLGNAVTSIQVLSSQLPETSLQITSPILRNPQPSYGPNPTIDLVPVATFTGGMLPEIPRHENYPSTPSPPGAQPSRLFLTTPRHMSPETHNMLENWSPRPNILDTDYGSYRNNLHDQTRAPDPSNQKSAELIDLDPFPVTASGDARSALEGIFNDLSGFNPISTATGSGGLDGKLEFPIGKLDLYQRPAGIYPKIRTAASNEDERQYPSRLFRKQYAGLSTDRLSTNSTLFDLTPATGLLDTNNDRNLASGPPGITLENGRPPQHNNQIARAQKTMSLFASLLGPNNSLPGPAYTSSKPQSDISNAPDSRQCDLGSSASSGTHGEGKVQTPHASTTSTGNAGDELVHVENPPPVESNLHSDVKLKKPRRAVVLPPREASGRLHGGTYKNSKVTVRKPRK